MSKYLDALASNRILVYGKVQGVFFRASTQSIASDLGLKGWVMNESDGSVSILATGPIGKIEKFIAWCHEGPILARVNRVITEEVDYEDFKDFSIRTS